MSRINQDEYWHELIETLTPSSEAHARSRRRRPDEEDTRAFRDAWEELRTGRVRRAPRPRRAKKS